MFVIFIINVGVDYFFEVLLELKGKKNFPESMKEEMENRRIEGKSYITVITNWESLDGF